VRARVQRLPNRVCSQESAASDPLAFLPWWDVEESVKELERCVTLGHRGVNWGSEFERLGCPSSVTSLDPVLARVQEMELPLSFHIGFGSHTKESLANWQTLTTIWLSQKTQFCSSLEREVHYGTDHVGNVQAVSRFEVRLDREWYVTSRSSSKHGLQYRNNRASVTRKDSYCQASTSGDRFYTTFWYERTWIEQ